MSFIGKDSKMLHRAHFNKHESAAASKIECDSYLITYNIPQCFRQENKDYCL